MPDPGLEGLLLSLLKGLLTVYWQLSTFFEKMGFADSAGAFGLQMTGHGSTCQFQSTHLPVIRLRTRSSAPTAQLCIHAFCLQFPVICDSQAGALGWIRTSCLMEKAYLGHTTLPPSSVANLCAGHASSKV